MLKLTLHSLFVCLLLPAIACADDTVSTKVQELIGNNDPSHEDWSIHAQATEVIQGYPSFSAPYNGPNSLPSSSQWRNTTTATLFLGRRLWSGAEIYYNPEEYEGVGINKTFGVAGFPNGEATKAGAYDFKTGDARIFIRQVIGLGGPTEKIESGQNQLAGEEDISRLTITAGKFAASDIFDNNSYTHDPRTQFLNWSLMESAAWDYPANARGYDDGIALEFNQKTWVLRYGAFLMSKFQNADTLPTRGLKSLGQVAELEERYTIKDNPGKIHFLIFLNRARQGNYQDAFNLGGNVNDAIATVEKYGNVKYGFAISAEQQLTESLGAFTRLSWNDGKTEDWEFTQVDESVAAGLSINGKQWNRPDDVWGIAGVINGLSSDQKKFLEQGGLGLIIGDGRLNYSPEMIFETYYALKITSYATLSPDYQFVVNPAYNADRGPVNIFAVRFHLEF